MTRRRDNSAEGREADRLFSGLWKRGVVVPSRDDERGANEGLGHREIKGLDEENGPAVFGRNRAESIIRWRAHAGGHDVPEHRGTPRTESSR